MERALSAYPREGLALVQAAAAGLDRWKWATAPLRGAVALQAVEVGAAAALIGWASLELLRDDRTMTLGLLGAGLLLALRAFSRRLDASSAQHGGSEVAVSETNAPTSRDRWVLQREIAEQLAAQHAADRDMETTASGSPATSATAWGDLLARVSHDLRTPLNAVIGFSDVMGSELFGPVGDDRYREYIGHIRDSGRELLRSAEDTLAITQLVGSKGRTQDVLALAQLAHEAAARTGGFIDVDIDADVEVVGDRQGLRQALANLVSEAKQRAGLDGDVRCHATIEDEFVIVQLTADVAPALAGGQDASLRICMARVLLELQGARLIEFERDGVWRAMTALSRAAQPDFFIGAAVSRPGVAQPSQVSLAN